MPPQPATAYTYIHTDIHKHFCSFFQKKLNCNKTTLLGSKYPENVSRTLENFNFDGKKLLVSLDELI